MTSDRLGWQSRLITAAVIPATILASARFFWRSGAAGRVLAASLASAAGAWLARAATPRAALSGSILASTMLLGSASEDAGEQAPDAEPVNWARSPLPALATLIVLTLTATRYRREEKRKPERSGRNASQITANLGIAALVAVLPVGRDRKMTMLVAALSEATADTLSSEFGEVLGGEPYLITTGRRAPAGTDGAISLAGSLAGAVGAGAVVLAALPALRGNSRDARRGPGRAAEFARLPIAAGAGAITGLLVDSLLGATAEQHGWINNDAVNFLSTAAAALATYLLTR